MTGFATASFLAFGTLLVLFGASATEIIQTLHLDYADFGLLGSMLSLGLGVGIVSAGPMTDRLPRRPLYIASCLTVVVATMTLGPQTTYDRLLIHMIAIGLGAGFYETVLNTVIVEEFGVAAGRRLLFIHSGASFAACVVPLLIGFVRETSLLPWHETFWYSGLLHIPLIVVASFVSMKRTPRHIDAQPTSRESSFEPRANNELALAAICVATFAYVGVETALTIFVVDHTTTDLGLDSVRGARTISAFWGGLLVGRLASGLSPRSPGAGTVSLFALSGAGLVLAFGLGSFDEPELAMAAAGLALGGVFPVMIALAGLTLPSSPATAVGLAGGLGSLGGFVVPWYTGRLASSAGLPFAIAALSGWLLLLVASAATVRFRRAG